MSLDEIKSHPFLKGVSWSNLSQNSLFFVPGEVEDFE